MEILSTSGKKYLIEEKFAPEFIKVLLSSDFSGQKILPDNISDSVYDVIINYFNTGKIKEVNQEIITALDFLGYDLPEYGFSQEVSFARDYQIIWLEEYWVKKNFLLLPDYGNSTLIKYSEIKSEIRSEIINDKDVIFFKPNLSEYVKGKEKIPLIDQNESAFAIAGGYALDQVHNRGASDIDYFHISNSAQPNQEEARDDLNRILQTQVRNKNIFTISRTKNAVTVDDPSGNHQFVLRSYRSIAEVVYGFDIDCCGIILYQGEIYLTPRCAYSLKHLINTVDLTKCSTSYEYRLFKYWKRGFSIKIVGFDYNRLNYRNLTLFNRIDYFTYCIEKEAIIVIDRDNRKYYLQGVDILLNLIFGKNRQINISDYDYTEKLFDLSNNDFSFKSKEPYMIDINGDYIFIYKKIIKGDFSPDGRLDNLLLEFDLADHPKLCTNVPEKLSFLLESPGQQLSGSFHKITINDYTKWFDGYSYNYQKEKTIQVEYFWHDRYKPFKDASEYSIDKDVIIWKNPDPKISLYQIRRIRLSIPSDYRDKVKLVWIKNASQEDLKENSVIRQMNVSGTHNAYQGFASHLIDLFNRIESGELDINSLTESDE